MPGIFTLSATPSSNTVIDGINVAENCAAGNINNAIRSLAAITRQTFSSGLENFLAGTSPLALTSGGTGLSSALTANALVKQGASALAQSIISDDGTTVTVAGPVAMSSNKITGLANGTASNDAANVGQIAATYLPFTGGTLTGALNGTSLTMSGNGQFVSPGSGSVGGVIVRDAPGNPNATYIQFTNNSGGTQYGWIRGLAAGGVDLNGVVTVDGASGRLGVGTSAPSALFDVNGAARVRGGLTLDTALALLQGGTGATTAAGARTNLGAQAALTFTSNANGQAIGITIGATTYYIQWMPVGALGVNGSTTLTYPVALTTSVYAAFADKYVAGPINDGLNLFGVPGLSSLAVVNGGTAMSGGYAMVVGF